MDIAQLTEHFAIPGVLAFHETPAGLIYAAITTPHATATVYIQGAHVTHWQPTGHAPVIFVSRKSEFAPGKPIRGGVPISFPWFANRHDGKTGPSHGFARIQPWTLAFAALTGDDLHLTFTLGSTQMSRDLGFDQFRLAYQLTIGRTLTLQLVIANDAEAPLVFEEALHTYYAVADAHKATIDGLDGVIYLDKTEGFKPKMQDGAVTFSGPTDRMYENTTATCVLHDVSGKRRITAEKAGSSTTVVWNPWESGAAKLPDMDASEWNEFLCCETVNAGANAIALAHDESHAMRLHISVEKT
jgi:glucose-6-phosphate 1-epimerase